jgi:integrase
MSVKLRGKTYNIVFRPFGQQIMLALKDCHTKRQAGFIKDELTYALRTKDYGRLTGSAREACIRLFRNQKWEFPPELAPTPVQNPSKVFTLWDAVQLYVNDESFKCLSKPDRYEQAIFHLVKYFGKNKTLKEIWVPDLKLYRTYRSSNRASNATINREISALSGIFRVVVEHQVIESNPCRLLKRLSEKSSQRRVYIGFDDIQKIVAECPDWYQDMILVSYFSGMRKGEIHKLRWRHINLNTRIISFHATETKEGNPKRVPIHKDLLPIFDRIGKVRSLSDDKLFETSSQSLRCPWVRALDKLHWSDPRPTFHDLRHTWKTNARRSGIDSEIREMILGHSDRTLTISERYGIISDKELVNTIDKFTYDNGLTEILVASKAGK